MLHRYIICALADYSVYINLYQQAFSGAVAGETVAELTSNLAYPCIIIILSFIFPFFFTMDLESTPIY